LRACRRTPHIAFITCHSLRPAPDQPHDGAIWIYRTCMWPDSVVDSSFLAICTLVRMVNHWIVVMTFCPRMLWRWSEPRSATLCGFESPELANQLLAVARVLRCDWIRCVDEADRACLIRADARDYLVGVLLLWTFLGNKSPFALLPIYTHGGDDSLSGLFETRIGRTQRVECRDASSVDFDAQQDPMVASWSEQIHNNVVDVTDIGRPFEVARLQEKPEG
ncbi:hypothetical protein KCU95_g122, partial [Aureobasidium melanogenum]